MNDCRILHVKITLFHPKANGTVESFVQIINKSLRTAIHTGHSNR